MVCWSLDIVAARRPGSTVSWRWGLWRPKGRAALRPLLGTEKKSGSKYPILLDLIEKTNYLITILGIERKNILLCPNIVLFLGMED